MSLFLFIAYFVKFIASIYWLVICCFVNCICDPHIRYKNRQKCYSKTQIYISISKIFQIKFASFPVIIFPSNHLPKDFICTVAYFTDYSSLVFSLFYGSQVYKSLSSVLGDTMYIVVYLVISLRGFCDLRMLPPQNPCHYVKALTIPICKLLLLNDEAILTYLL